MASGSVCASKQLLSHCADHKLGRGTLRTTRRHQKKLKLTVLSGSSAQQRYSLPAASVRYWTDLCPRDKYAIDRYERRKCRCEDDLDRKVQVLGGADQALEGAFHMEWRQSTYRAVRLVNPAKGFDDSCVSALLSRFLAVREIKKRRTAKWQE